MSSIITFRRLVGSLREAMWPRGATRTYLIFFLAAMIAKSQMVAISAAADRVAQSEDDLIKGFKDPQTQLILLKVDMVLTPAKWPAVTIKRNLTVKGENMTAPDAPPGTARPLLMDFNFLYMKWTIAPNHSLTFEDLELVNFNKVPKVTKDIVAASPGGTLIWRKSWQHWTNFTDLNDFAKSSNNILRSEAFPGKQQVSIISMQECKEEMPWPGACATAGMKQDDFATDTKLITTFTGPLGQEAEGGYVWACLDCYLSTDAPLDPACIAMKGVTTCYSDIAIAKIAARANPRPAAAAGDASSNGSLIGAIVGGVVGGVALAVLGLLLFRWQRRADTSEVLHDWEYAPVAVVEGSQYPSGYKVLPRAPPPADLPLALQSGVAIGGLVGVGSFGMVHKGLYNSRPVALKLLMNRHPDTVARVHQEVQITAAVHHDNVAATYCYLQLDRESLLATGKASVAQLALDMATTGPQGTRQGSTGSLYGGARNLSHYFIAPSGSSGHGTANLLPVNGVNMMPRMHLNSPLLPISSTSSHHSSTDAAVTSGFHQSQQDSRTRSNAASPNRQSANVVTSGGSNTMMGLVCLVLEYLAGGSLQVAVESGLLHDRQGLVDLMALWPLLVDVARGMAALHAMGVCHGDLKADNCMLSKPLHAPCTCDCHKKPLARPLPLRAAGQATAGASLGTWGSSASCHFPQRVPAVLETIKESLNSTEHVTISGEVCSSSGQVALQALPEGKATAQGMAVTSSAGREAQGQHTGGAVGKVPAVSGSQAAAAAAAGAASSTRPANQAAMAAGAGAIAGALSSAGCANPAAAGAGAATEGYDRRRIWDSANSSRSPGGAVALEMSCSAPTPEPEADEGEEQGGNRYCCSKCRAVVKITDFGLVRALGPLATHVSTASHGTVTHMPPEVLMEGKLRPAADVYSYGIMVYELVTGKRAWEGCIYPQIVRMVGIDDARPQLPYRLPQLVTRIIQNCWAKDPASRPSFQQLLDIMTAAYESGQVAKAQQDLRAEIDELSGFF